VSVLSGVLYNYIFISGLSCEHILADRELISIDSAEGILDVVKQESVVFYLEYNVVGIQHGIHIERRGVEVEACFRGADIAVEGDANFVFLRHKRLSGVFHYCFGAVKIHVHKSIALSREILGVEEQRGVVAGDEYFRVFARNFKGALELVLSLLLLHLKHSEIVGGIVYSQAYFTAQFKTVKLSEIISVVYGVKIKGAYGVSDGAIVSVLGEKLLKISAFDTSFLSTDKKFFFFSVNVIQISLLTVEKIKALLKNKSIINKSIIKV
jgi:hypothetical protein